MKPKKILRSKFLKNVEKLVIGEIAYITYDAMWVDYNDDLYVDLYSSCFYKELPKDGYVLKIKRVEKGVIVYYSRKNHRWQQDNSSTNEKMIFNYPEDSLMVVARNDREYEKLINNPSLEEIEDEIHEKINELSRIENEFYRDEKEFEKDFQDIAFRARQCQAEIDILVIKREEILEKKEMKEKQRQRKERFVHKQ